MNPAEEKLVRQNWSIIQQDIDVDELVRRFTSHGIFTSAQGDDILAVLPNTTQGKGERFVEAVISCGPKAYQTLCNILLETSHNPALIQALKVQTDGQTLPGGPSMTESCEGDPHVMGAQRVSPPMMEAGQVGPPMMESGRQGTAFSILSSNTSLSLSDGPCTESDMGDLRGDRMVSARAPWREEFPKHEEANMDTTDDKTDGADARPTTPAQAVQRAVERASNSKNGSVDMDTLEQELVKIAPTIADLFNKIHKQTNTVVAASEDELQQIKHDNDRLRRTNRSLVEKLNSFQQKIIQLQLENKKLREISDNEKLKVSLLNQRSSDLDSLKERLLEQKKALEEKEMELEKQMANITVVLKDNQAQKMQLDNLEQQHEEGLIEFEEQQTQIEELKQDKVIQSEKIRSLEESQRYSEHMLYRLEERLQQLEKGPTRSRNRSKFGLSRPWMNGAVNKSHNVIVKCPNFPTDFSANAKGGKGWSF